MPLELQDLTGLGKGIDALCDLVKTASGAIYKPYGIRREADAEAYKYRLMEQTKSLAEIEKQEIIKGNIPPELLAQSPLLAKATARAQLRMIDAQANIENVLTAAEGHLLEDQQVNAPEKEWMDTFFSTAETISDIRAQEVWGRVLAGEVATPGSYSKRSLETLRNMTSHEAKLFQRACQFAHDDSAIFNFSDYSAPEIKDKLKYSELLALSSLGLLHSSDNIHLPYSVPNLLSFRGETLLLGEENSGPNDVPLPIYPFTQIGRELAKLVDARVGLDWLTHVGYILKSIYKTPAAIVTLEPATVPKRFHVVAKRELGTPLETPQS